MFFWHCISIQVVAIQYAQKAPQNVFFLVKPGKRVRGSLIRDRKTLAAAPDRSSLPGVSSILRDLMCVLQQSPLEHEQAQFINFASPENIEL